MSKSAGEALWPKCTSMSKSAGEARPLSPKRTSMCKSAREAPSAKMDVHVQIGWRGPDRNGHPCPQPEQPSGQNRHPCLNRLEKPLWPKWTSTSKSAGEAPLAKMDIHVSNRPEKPHWLKWTSMWPCPHRPEMSPARAAPLANMGIHIQIARRGPSGQKRHIHFQIGQRGPSRQSGGLAGGAKPFPPKPSI